MPEYLAPGVYVEEVSHAGKSFEDIGLASNTESQLNTLSNDVLRARKAFQESSPTQPFQGRPRGIRVLFTGASGTGKTLAAQVLANKTGANLYKADLSLVISKYIGETEKNLNQAFEAAEGSNEILFFDEADALFGKRSEIKDAHDQYANMETNYLLERLEDFKGIVVLATNLKEDIDAAFLRRINFIIDFTKPESKERISLWKRIRGWIKKLFK